MSIFSKLAPQVGSRLIQLKQTVSVAESSTGGLISAQLLSVPGASAYFVGGSVVYTLASRRSFLDIDKTRVKSLKPLTEAMVMEFALAARLKLDTTWGVAELGAAGPKGTPYGHDAGISVIGISGPIDASITIKTESNNREENMVSFTEHALSLFFKVLMDNPSVTS